ncbi:hypothetical protein D3C73_1648000 [compost metagenome]
MIDCCEIRKFMERWSASWVNIWFIVGAPYGVFRRTAARFALSREVSQMAPAMRVLEVAVLLSTPVAGV